MGHSDTELAGKSVKILTRTTLWIPIRPWAMEPLNGPDETASPIPQQPRTSAQEPAHGSALREVHTCPENVLLDWAVVGELAWNTLQRVPKSARTGRLFNALH